MKITHHPDPVGHTENADGTPHLAYYDNDRTTSFVWSGSIERPIAVCPNGYGEPATAFIHLDATDFGLDTPTVPSIIVALTVLRDAANIYLEPTT